MPPARCAPVLSEWHNSPDPDTNTTIVDICTSVKQAKPTGARIIIAGTLGGTTIDSLKHNDFNQQEVRGLSGFRDRSIHEHMFVNLNTSKCSDMRGLDLGGADILIFVDTELSTANHTQVIGRIFRPSESGERDAHVILIKPEDRF